MYRVVAKSPSGERILETQANNTEEASKIASETLRNVSRGEALGLFRKGELEDMVAINRWLEKNGYTIISVENIGLG